MSHAIIPAVETGTRQVISLLEATVKEKIAQNQDREPIAFNDTLFPLPIAYALLGVDAPTYSDLPALVGRFKGIAEGKDSALNIEGLEGTVNRGLATALSVELLKALQKGKEATGIGFIADNILRSLGLLLVDGRMPGVAVIVGKAPNAAIAERIIRDFQRRNILSLIVGNQAKESVLEQLQENNVEIGLETYVVPLGGDIGSAVYALNFAMRAALTFGGVRLARPKRRWITAVHACPLSVSCWARSDRSRPLPGLPRLRWASRSSQTNRLSRSARSERPASKPWWWKRITRKLLAAVSKAAASR